MNLKMNKIVTIPEAENVIKAFRADGRSYKQAFAEFVDNSIDAQATFVEIQINREGATYSARIIDDGIGMDNPMLIRALSLGASTEKKELSKFGIGMKVAAMSMFDNIEIATKTETGPVLIGRQNFAEMSSENSFEAFIGVVDDKTYIHPVERGTVIDLSHDRKNFPSANWVNLLKIHLSQIFRNYILGDSFKIIVNGTQLIALDPLDIEDSTLRHFQHNFTNILDEEDSKLSGYIDVRISYLEEGVTARSRHGLYVIRNNREVQSGGQMCSVSGNKMTFPKNIRIEIRYDSIKDTLIQVDSKKTSVLLNYAFYKGLKDFLTSCGPTVMSKPNATRKKATSDFIKKAKKKKDALSNRLKGIINASKILDVPDQGDDILFVAIMDDDGLRIEVNTSNPKWKGN